MTLLITFPAHSILTVQWVEIKNAPPWVLFFHALACIYAPEINSLISV